MEGPGLFVNREPPIKFRNWEERAFTVGVSGPVGSGKTALLLQLCLHLRDKLSLGVVTNDIFTREDAEFLTKHQALPVERIVAVETGGCPHAAIREDISMNLSECEILTTKFNPDLIFVESGGDNLAATFSRELADFIIYVIDVAGGDKIPRKGGPGITQSDLLVINKVDLAEAVGADLELMERQAREIRQGGPVVMANIKKAISVPEIVEFILNAKDEQVLDCTGKGDPNNRLYYRHQGHLGHDGSFHSHGGYTHTHGESTHIGHTH
eukprot:TRINITY_DN4331_c0_g4_i4.p1 TRINITY_DN4331_c0_g4~~TRINITY_DN4331_c0_g4_i4.p1  ORF type:complete len:268 (-),score=53.47 TRINITY_DN4331_c0_g4_i4:75-878(-)